MELTGLDGTRRLPALGVAVALLVAVTLAGSSVAAATATASGGPAASRSAQPSLRGGGEKVAESIANRITDPAFTRVLWSLLQIHAVGASEKYWL